MTIIAALIVAAAVLVAARQIATSRSRPAKDDAGVDPLAVMQLFAPGIEAVQRDPRALLVWQPLARTARRLQPDVFSALDAANDARFPFSNEQIEAAHARWTAEWLSWERRHDAEFRLKAAVASEDAARSGAPAARMKIDEIEREKIDGYQQRYEEYVRVSKALQSLTGYES